MDVRRADFSRVLIGLEPVIQGPRAIEPVLFGSWEFTQEVLPDGEKKFWLPIGAPAVYWPTWNQLRYNPILPAWRTWPDEIHQVPYPAEHRWLGFTESFDQVVEVSWPIVEVNVDWIRERWPVADDPLQHREFIGVGAWPESLASVAARYTRQAFGLLWGASAALESERVQQAAINRGQNLILDYVTRQIWERDNPPVPVAGDEQSHVPEETIATLVELARQDRYQDFVDLAGAVGVGKSEWDALWRGTRARVGAPVEDEDPPF